MAEKEYAPREIRISSGTQIDLTLRLNASGKFALVSQDMIGELEKLDRQRLSHEKRLPIVLNGATGIGIEVLLGTRKSDGTEVTLIPFGSLKIDLIGCKQRSFKDNNYPVNHLHDGACADTRVMRGFSFMMGALSGEQLTVTGIENGIRVRFKHKPTP